MSRVRLSRIFWIGAAAVLVAAALVALAAIVRGDFSDTDGRILGTLAAALLAGSTLVGGLVLAERGSRAPGWAAVALVPPAFGLLVYVIWDFVFDGGGDDSWRYGWTGALALVATLVAVTARLLARSNWVVALARVAGALAVIAAGVSIAAIWMESPGDTIGKTLAVLWVATGLCYLLVPVLERLSSADESHGERVLAELGGVELVATRSADALDARLARGERLLLRRRS